MTLRTPRWFVIQSGEHAGRLHMAGWAHTAIKTAEDWSRDNDGTGGWLSLAVCPRCSTLVLAGDKHVYGDQTWAHEQWHAETDYPVPADVAAEALRAALKAAGQRAG